MSKASTEVAYLNIRVISNTQEDVDGGTFAKLEVEKEGSSAAIAAGIATLLTEHTEFQTIISTALKIIDENLVVSLGKIETDKSKHE